VNNAETQARTGIKQPGQNDRMQSPSSALANGVLAPKSAAASSAKTTPCCMLLEAKRRSCAYPASQQRVELRSPSVAAPA
jgi:hypothetical protein